MQTTGYDTDTLMKESMTKDTTQELGHPTGVLGVASENLGRDPGMFEFFCTEFWVSLGMAAFSLGAWLA